MDALFDPDSLRDREDVRFREETYEVTHEELAEWESLDGVGVLGVTDGGRVLLMNGPHGWRLPYYSVESGEDWVAATRAVGERLTGGSVDVLGPERVNRVEHRLDGADERHVTHDVVFRATLVGEASTERDPDADDRTAHIDEVEWFDEVPEGVYDDHEDTIDDIRLFLD